MTSFRGLWPENPHKSLWQCLWLFIHSKRFNTVSKSSEKCCRAMPPPAHLPTSALTRRALQPLNSHPRTSSGSPVQSYAKLLTAVPTLLVVFRIHGFASLLQHLLSLLDSAHDLCFKVLSVSEAATLSTFLCKFASTSVQLLARPLNKNSPPSPGLIALILLLLWTCLSTGN